MRILFILNTIFELVVAVVSAVMLNNLVLAGNALALTTLSLLMVRTIDSQTRWIGLVVFTVFHIAIALAWLWTWATTGVFNGALIAHGLFAVAFSLFLARRGASLG